MSTQYRAPVDDYVFLLHDVIAPVAPHMLGDLTRNDTRQVLDQAARFFEEVWAPLDGPADEEGCHFEDGAVRTPAGYRAGYDALCEAGWNRVSAPEASGGAGLPEAIGQAVREFSASACNSLGLYAGLTAGAHATVRRTGEPWMLKQIVPPMVDGRWAGTMCLTEPHCGTDLRLMTTRAMPQPDGSWRLSGTKIFISGGDQDLTENVIHLVLAKVPDESGRLRDDLSTVRLFLVPKRVVDPDTGTLGDRNGVVVAGIEHKMGLKGSATCTMSFEHALAYPLRESSQPAGSQRKSSAGMSGMFDMMNSARLGTGLQALSSATRAYGHAAVYARDRLAGRAAKAEDRTGGAADPIVGHPDVRRLLLKQASFLEAARALALQVRTLLDEPDDALHGERSAIGSLLTPVVKAFFSDRSFESANDAMQLMGGHGYIRDNGVEQLVRDCRIFQLYEGANGVQALDLVLRKLPAAGGHALAGFLDLIEATASEARQWEPLREQADALRQASQQIRACGQWFADPARDPYDAGASSSDFLAMMGIVACAWMCLRMSVVALDLLPAAQDRAFLERKLDLARYWFARELPLVSALRQRVETGAACLMAIPSERF
ncbi:acyl-CoA dehydrogenase C-terminal domain-containing protein [Cupriavidus consociatus]|uniref:acyl-CoA dehydrogenase C-terminal domain-containing protein n=1 Tax=Cupriavidus consociatus TaxID=2821357 RepID=UPI001AE67E64|nr:MULTISPECIES: acyl-CoA dehydrogenase C-terminal domain-containing protein [unclassified Cupriavidus]MBP0618897.1 acyl-CoA dehydrogenase C-terminal domain-containing protein [Cupriavidus sp. LEh25]MDK2655540.1 acyl-CoA dehydrogenase C-terminal domain-containing protein [Cupriavidus sp. LEh21]